MAIYWIDYSVAGPGSGTQFDPFSSMNAMRFLGTPINPAPGDEIRIAKTPEPTATGIYLDWNTDGRYVYGRGINVEANFSPGELIAIDETAGWYQIYHSYFNGTDTEIELFHVYAGWEEGGREALKPQPLETDAGVLDFICFQGTEANPIRISGGWSRTTGLQDGITAIRWRDPFQDYKRKDGLGFVITGAEASVLGQPCEHIEFDASRIRFCCGFGAVYYTNAVQNTRLINMTAHACQFGLSSMYLTDFDTGETSSYNPIDIVPAPIYRNNVIENFRAFGSEVVGMFPQLGHQFRYVGKQECNGGGGLGFVAQYTEYIEDVDAFFNGARYIDDSEAGYEEIPVVTTFRAEFDLASLNPNEISETQAVAYTTMPLSGITITDSPHLEVTGSLTGMHSRTSLEGLTFFLVYLVTIASSPFGRINHINVNGTGNSGTLGGNCIYLYGRNFYVNQIDMQQNGYCGAVIDVTDLKVNRVNVQTSVGVALLFVRATGTIGEMNFDFGAGIGGGFGFCDVRINKLRYTNLGINVPYVWGPPQHVAIDFGFDFHDVVLGTIPFPGADFFPFIQEVPPSAKTDAPQIRVIDYNGTNESVVFNQSGKILENSAEAESGKCAELYLVDRPLGLTSLDGNEPPEYSYPVKLPLAILNATQGNSYALTVNAKCATGFAGVAEVAIFVDDIAVVEWTEIPGLTTTYQTFTFDLDGAFFQRAKSFITVFVRGRVPYAGDGTYTSSVYFDSLTLTDSPYTPPASSTWDIGNKTSTLLLSSNDTVGTVSGLTHDFAGAFSSKDVGTGKAYAEITMTNFSGNASIGFWGKASPIGSPLGPPNAEAWNEIGTDPQGYTMGIRPNGDVLAENQIVVPGVCPYSSGDTLRFAIDWNLGLLWIGDPSGVWVTGGDPALGTGGLPIGLPAGSALYLCAQLGTDGDIATINTGQNPWVFSLPSGFVGWGS